MIKVRRLKQYPDYGISRCGKVWSFRSAKWLKQIKDSHGYMIVNLHNGLKRNHKTAKVHRIVAQYYIGNPSQFPMINHKDEDKGNNRADNLEYCTAQYNTEYSLAKTCHLLNPDGELIEVFNLRKFARDNNLNASALSKVTLGKATHHKGWRLAC